MKYDIIVLGSGPGGYVAAIRSAQLGYKTAIIERESLGGICLNWGCIPTKALLKSAQVYNYIKHSEDYGISLEGNSLIEMEKVVARSRAVAENMSKGIEYLMKKNAIDVIKGTGRLIGDKKIEVKGEETNIFVADHIIIATGARSKQLPSLPQDGEKIIGYRKAMTLTKQPKTMVVVGSGAIGSEFAYFYQSIGTQVTLVEFMPQIVPAEDKEVASTLQRCFKKMGMKVYTSTSVKSVDTTQNDKCLVTLSGKNKEEVIEADIVLSAVGIKTNIENIGLEELGIKLSDNKEKIIVDDFYRTNLEGIYAIGDIISSPALAHVASKEAITCIEAIKGLNPNKVNYNNVPACTYTSPEIASVGLTEDKAKEMGMDIKVGKFMFMASGKASASGNRDGFVKVVINQEDDKIIGCSMIGDNVTEMIEEIVLARQSNIKAHDVIDAIHPHPTMSEGVMEAIEAAYNKAIHG
ncbi:MAG: dihydrolipoyl dehydrogenase [Bacteroidales bacterium]|jgi:dihydrolipoamide dehydrogenase|nr:dihydrolipoyl dehydrogenase [Bacteroidales bacterium]